MKTYLILYNHMYYNLKMIRTICVVFAILGSVLGQQTCPAGWAAHSDSCYFLHSHDKYDWVESKGFCDSHNAHLVYVETMAENEFLKSMIRQRFADDDDDANVWMGATDEIQEGTFVWYHIEKPVTFTDWEPSEPNSGPLQEIEDCLVFWADYDWEWADLDCHEENFFICEKSANGIQVIG